MLKILPPGMDAPQGINELLLAPVHVETGALEDGIPMSRPAERWARSPWNDTPVRGRPVPEWLRIRNVVVAASSVLPGVPAIGWDILLSENSPLILEANKGISLFRASLWHFENGFRRRLSRSLRKWCSDRYNKCRWKKPSILRLSGAR